MAATGQLINGDEYTHSSITLDIVGIGQIFIAEINYSDNTTEGVRRGNSLEKLARTIGEYETTQDMLVSVEDHQHIIRTLGPGFMRKKFDINIAYRELDRPLIQDTIVAARITTNDSTSTAGSDAVMRRITMASTKILWDGIDPIALLA